MRPLNGMSVLALGGAADGALARLLTSFGAQVTPVQLPLANELPRADFLIEDMGLAALRRAGLTREQIEQINPRLIHVSVTTFGSEGPRAEWRGGELIASAMGGTLRVTGDVDRSPVKEALDACWFHADMVGAAGAMAALVELANTGRGQHVDVSVQEVAFSRNVNGVLVWQFDRRKLHRVGGALNYGRATVRCIWPLADGFCFHTLMTGRFGAPANQALSDWIDEAGLPNPLRGVDWTRYNRSTLDPQTRREWERAIEAFFSTRSRHEISTDGRRRGINATVVAEPSDVLADPHLEARNFWASDANGKRKPARFVAMKEGSQLAPPARSNTRVSERLGPLKGLRVLDFSWALVGSITTKVLGDLGCDIIKVETRGRPCLSRIDVQVNASRADSFDDKPWFAHLNTSKRSLALDLKLPQSRDVLDPLLDWADIVVENFSPGTMAKLGLDYASLQKRNPGVIMVSGSVFGQTGPLAESWGVDGTGAALSGRTFLTGWPDRNPVIPGAVPYGDVIVPYVMAAATAAAVDHRRRTGKGCHIDAAMYEICVQQMHDAITAAEHGKRPTRNGNDDPKVFHQGVYATTGDDQWIAITVPSQSDWDRLCAIAKLSATPRDAEPALKAWCLEREAHALMEQLQTAGIAAGVVQDIEDLIEHDPQIATRHALMNLEHPLLGAFGHVRTPITFSAAVTSPYRAPSIGEHSIAIASDLCGLSASRIEELERLGVFR
ncbi:CaiB/BaiF CoA-transferase family protein [Peristeroidobacter agariperforans]|uniref:CaiB/BaiF CoA-transferase family protein n=1 Tax=Peristeroidobacter agariperforans TaxID=268404 RepID=UPI00101D2262|nr:CoA transferase [Peristeroidobacter agariperforans]